GFLHGGADRFQKATWNIHQHGSRLSEVDEITLKDTFGANQEVCEGGLNISVFEQSQRPVWDDASGGFQQGWTDITSNFTGVSGVAAAGETGFETTITWGEVRYLRSLLLRLA